MVDQLVWVVIILLGVTFGWFLGSIAKLPNGSERYSVIFDEKMIDMLKKIQTSQNVPRNNALRNSVIVNFMLIEELEKNPAYRVAIIDTEEMEKVCNKEEMRKEMDGVVISIVELPKPE